MQVGCHSVRERREELKTQKSFDTSLPTKDVRQNQYSTNGLDARVQTQPKKWVVKIMFSQVCGYFVIER